jgi:hypothetical protein
MMASKLLNDILTDDSGNYFDLGAVTVFVMGLSLIGLSAFDLFESWHAYHLLIEHLKAVPTMALPPAPSFNAQNFGIACGALVSSFGANKWFSKSNNTSVGASS